MKVALDRPTRGAAALVCSLALFVAACASFPKGELGIDAVEIEGSRKLSAQAIKRCLLTVERDRVELVLGLRSGHCQAPPFDRSAPTVRLWRWWWTDWTAFNPAVVELDRERIERFYRARGFYDARVEEVRYDPPSADEPEVPSTHCDRGKPGCTVRVTFVVAEGEPIRVGRVRVLGFEAQPLLWRALSSQLALPQHEQRFDEVDHDRAKARLQELLAEASYAQAKVLGEVRIDHEHKRADIVYRVEHGPSYRFGETQIVGPKNLPFDTIRAVAGLETGAAYRPSKVREVQEEVYASGAFSVVEVSEQFDARAHTVQLKLKLTPLQRNAFRMGVGLTSGTLGRSGSDSVGSAPQWDVHLLGRYERRGLFGTLGKLRIEERPRLIFQRPFPSPRRPHLGNVLRVRLSVPGWIEARTSLITESMWDYGPDAFLGFIRSDLSFTLGLERAFLRRELFTRVWLQHDRYLVAAGERTNDGSPLPTSYAYTFAGEEIRVDLRDNENQPRKGAFLSMRSTQSVHMAISDWSQFELSPDVRVYVPLPLSIVLAARFSLSALWIRAAARSLDPLSRRLGPNSYRLRGGGAQGNRGFVAGELGVGREGGVRRWEASAELRVPLGGRFGLVGFFDAGNVTQSRWFQFGHWNPSVGFGTRIATPVGTVRTDVGFRVGPAREPPGSQRVFGQPGAIHLTIGEAF